MKTSLKLPMALLIGTAVLAGCKKDDDDPATPTPPVNEEEVITDVYIRFHDHDGNSYSWHASMEGGFHHDHGDGGEHEHEHEEGELHVHGDDLPANEHLHAEIILLNKSVTPADTVSHEVLEEGAAHQFFFIPENVDITFEYDDTDDDGRPIGLRSTWETGAAGTGEVKVILRHGLNKGASGVSDGDITNAGGETDLEIHFPVVIR